MLSGINVSAGVLNDYIHFSIVQTLAFLDHGKHTFVVDVY